MRETIIREPIATDNGNLKVTLSIGGVATADWPDDSANQLLQMADSALYRAKEEGRNRTVMAAAAEHEEVHRTVELTTHGPQGE